MICPYCKEEVEGRFEVDYAATTFSCACGCIFVAEYPMEARITIEEYPPERKPHYQTETERDNPRDPIIGRR